MRAGRVVLLSILSVLSGHAAYIFALYSAQYFAPYSTRERAVVAGFSDALFLSGRGQSTHVYWIVVRREDGKLNRFLCSHPRMKVDDDVELFSSDNGYVTTQSCLDSANKAWLLLGAIGGAILSVSWAVLALRSLIGRRET